MSCARGPTHGPKRCARSNALSSASSASVSGGHARADDAAAAGDAAAHVLLDAEDSGTGSSSKTSGDEGSGVLAWRNLYHDMPKQQRVREGCEADGVCNHAVRAMGADDGGPLTVHRVYPFQVIPCCPLRRRVNPSLRCCRRETAWRWATWRQQAWGRLGRAEVDRGGRFDDRLFCV